jgi:hypothetical protein
VRSSARGAPRLQRQDTLPAQRKRTVDQEAFSKSALNLIRRRLLDVIDDNHFHRSLRRYQQ